MPSSLREDAAASCLRESPGVSGPKVAEICFLESCMSSFEVFPLSIALDEAILKNGGNSQLAANYLMDSVFDGYAAGLLFIWGVFYSAKETYVENELRYIHGTSPGDTLSPTVWPDLNKNEAFGL
ncbi:unnamed protein product [Haemonchus placei]|uniref:Ammonium_transp domain-containing protein n=1 Tax=Haemonchus placei TaxID=6290 RepID=A0A0N4WB30_HAEPC|nr:unnamed protein product [Haemonchus placei]